MVARKAKSVSLARGLRTALLNKDVGRRAELGQLSRADHPMRGRNDALPPLELVQRSPSSLRAPKRNVRSNKAGHVKEVANSITELGFTVPVIINPDGDIIDGAVRVEAAIAIGLKEVPCIVAHARTAKEQRLLRLAANRLGEKGSWDLDSLTVELQELVFEGSPVAVTGFESFEVDALLTVTPTVAETGPVEPDGQPTIAKVGDVFLLGRHRLMCGDARQPTVLSQLMDGKTARLVLTDQPYNVPISGNVTRGPHDDFVMASGELSVEEFQTFIEDWVVLADSHLADGGILTTFTDWRGLPSVYAACLAIGLEQLNLAVWAKTNPGMGSFLRSQYELVPLFKKGNAPPVNNVALGSKGRSRSNLWPCAGASTIGSGARDGLKYHPTVKPVVLLADAILDMTMPGDIVLDPFLGSGSTLVAAEKSGRVCYGVELDPKYVDVILRRYRNVTGRDARLESTGQRFPELIETRSRAFKQDLEIKAPERPVPSRGRDRPARRAALASAA